MKTATENESKHTPGPWNVEKTGLEDYPLAIYGADEFASGPVCELHIQGEGEEVANAAFIVSACNQHESLLAQRDALLAALLKIKERSDYCELFAKRDEATDWMEKMDEVTEIALAAIAMADAKGGE
jgi:hypothetical protein